MNESFQPDPKMQQIADAYALDAIDFCKNNFQLQLDWSDESVGKLELVLETFHSQLSQANPTEEQVMRFAKMFGSYLGETYRKNYDAIWGMVTLQDQTFPGMENRAGTRFWPWGRVRNRLVEGKENNVWHYYKDLIPDSGKSIDLGKDDLKDAKNDRKKSWVKRIFG